MKYSLRCGIIRKKMIKKLSKNLVGNEKSRNFASLLRNNTS